MIVGSFHHLELEKNNQLIENFFNFNSEEETSFFDGEIRVILGDSDEFEGKSGYFRGFKGI